MHVQSCQENKVYPDIHGIIITPHWSTYSTLVRQEKIISAVESRIATPIVKHTNIPVCFPQ